MDRKLKNFIYKPLDKGIAPLVQAMNKTGWIMTYSSCEGHSIGSKYPSVSFWCKSEKLIVIDEIIKNLKSEFNKQYPEFIEVRKNIVCESQYLEWKSFLWFEFNTDEIERGGWSSLSIVIRSCDPTKKFQVITSFTDHINYINNQI